MLKIGEKVFINCQNDEEIKVKHAFLRFQGTYIIYIGGF